MLRSGFSPEDISCAETDEIMKMLARAFELCNGKIGFGKMLKLNPYPPSYAHGLIICLPKHLAFQPTLTTRPSALSL